MIELAEWWPLYFDPTSELDTYEFDGDCTDLTVSPPAHGSRFVSLSGEQPGPLFRVIMDRHGIPEELQDHCTLEEFIGFKDATKKYTFCFDGQPVERGWSGDLLVEARDLTEKKVHLTTTHFYNNPDDPFLNSKAVAEFFSRT